MLNSPIILTSPINKTPILEHAKIRDFTFHCGKCRIKKKRALLPLVATFGLITIDIFQNYIYLPLVIFSIFFIIFWNFPWMVYISNTRPLYYEDLFIDSKLLIAEKSSENTMIITSPSGRNKAEINPIIRQRFERKFLNVLIFTNSLFMAALADYWLYKSNFDNRYGIDDQSENDYYEIIGVTGGILKIFQFFNNTIGSVMLHFIYEQLKKEHQTITRRLKAKSEKCKKLETEMITLENINHRITDSPPKSANIETNIRQPSKLASVVIVRDYEKDSDDE